MNPSAIFLRDTKPTPPPARQSSAAKAPFSVPVEAGDERQPPQRTNAGQRDEPGRTAAIRAAAENRVREQRETRQDQEARGPGRDEPARKDEKANRSEPAGRRSARADEVSNRDKTKILGTEKKTSTDGNEPGDKPGHGIGDEAAVTPEAAALEALAEQATPANGLVDGATPETAGEPSAKAEAATAGKADAVTTPLTQATELVANLAAPVVAVAQQATDGTAEQAGAPAIGEGEGKPAAPAHSAMLQGATAGALAEGSGEVDAASGEASAMPAAENAEGQQKAETQLQDQKPALKPGLSGEAKLEAAGMPQPASQRLDPLPPGLATLPENARALQAQAVDGKPGLGQQPHGPRVPETQPTSLAALPIEIGFRALSGTKRFDIRLDPPELGRVDVTLSFDKEGEVTAKLTVERVETLHLLQRDARTLERAFDQAGLRTSDVGIQLSLSDRNAGQGSFQAEQERSRTGSAREDQDIKPQLTELMPPPRRVRLGGVDLNI